MKPTIAITTMPPTPDPAIFPMTPLAELEPSTVLNIWLPTPPPTTPAMVLPRGPRLRFLGEPRNGAAMRLIGIWFMVLIDWSVVGLYMRSKSYVLPSQHRPKCEVADSQQRGRDDLQQIRSNQVCCKPGAAGCCPIGLTEVSICLRSTNHSQYESQRGDSV